ncbi:M64 family metallopeptidase [Micromonospora sp. WMMD1102]|uniref:M64 family metallopeptidase n=1 Tax=Micromonospora sp. WMMD1102 TaxID=3016105 RepID=UPI0024158D22|nr:M64 family metallopeptidase [Micromonospora sp. WMMD1102]MDG4787516.1 M64 family metallopeptidase [Micromonospora sp. WMMD1102]
MIHVDRCRSRVPLGRRRLAVLAPLTLLAGLLGLAQPGPAAADPEVGSARLVPLQVTGPASERLNLILLGDGYTAAELPKFHADVDRHLNVQWSIEPYRGYRNYFNVYVIEIVSGESGIRCDPDDDPPAPDRITPLGLHYADGCTNPLARGITFQPYGTSALDRYLQQLVAPLGVTASNRQILAIANTDTYGGIGGTNATTSGGAPQGPLISPHELGHSLGQLQDEYPYYNRPDPGGPYCTDDCAEPGSRHHTRLTEQQMVAQQAKWWRWLGEESESGGTIGRHESGMYASSDVWRPSEHSIMRWLGFHYDQVSREIMAQRISGRRDTDAMALSSTRTDRPVGPTDVLWVETQHPVHHELDVRWAVDGVPVPATHNSRNLALADLDVQAGAVVRVTVSDPTEFVRDPAIRNGPALTQSRQWTVGAEPTPPTPVQVGFTAATPTERPVGGQDVVYVEPTHPVDRVLAVTWRLDGKVLPNPHNSRNLDLGTLRLAPGSYRLTATVTDPVAPDGGTQTLAWTVDNVAGGTTATLSTPVATLAGDTRHHVYFERFTMGLDPTDDRPGYTVGEFRLDRDGWFNYFGWPDAPAGTPFLFSPTGTVVKSLVYGNLGSGGLSRAVFERTEPGYGTHTVEHRAIDAAGNIGPAAEFRATVLPGSAPACTRTISGSRAGDLTLQAGVTCLDNARVAGRISVRPGASLVVSGGAVAGGISADRAAVVQFLGTTVSGSVRLHGTTGSVTSAGSTFSGAVRLTGNAAGEHGLALVGNRITGSLTCTGNGRVADFGARNEVRGQRSGDCARL